MGYSPWGDKELDTTERLTLSFCFYFPLILKIKHLMPHLLFFALLQGSFLSQWYCCISFLPHHQVSLSKSFMHLLTTLYPASLSFPVLSAFMDMVCCLLPLDLSQAIRHFKPVYVDRQLIFIRFSFGLAPSFFLLWSCSILPSFSRAQTLSALPHLPSWVLCLVGFGSVQETLGEEFWRAHFAGAV